MHDFRYALRTLFRTPSFTLTAILTLALGIGASTAVFSIVNAVLLEPLPFRDPDRLVVARLSVPDFKDVQRASRSFESTAIWATNIYTLQVGENVQQIMGGVISRELLPLLGVTPVIGRNFGPEDDVQRTVILGYGLWQSLYGGDEAVVGRVLDLSGIPHTVIGVAPANFRFPAGQFQLWTPFGMVETQAQAQAANRGLRIFSALGRLKSDVTFAQARDELLTIGRQLATAHPATNADAVLQIESLEQRMVGDVRQRLWILLATVGLLLFIACANVANLLLSRMATREREMAVRAALGAGRGRLVRQLAVESLVLAAAGGAAGLLVAMWAVDFLPSLLETRLPRAEAIRVDGLVLLAALCATLLSAVVFGAAPALSPGNTNALKDAGRGVTGGTRARRLRHVVIVAEVALSIVIVVGAGLLIRSFAALTAKDPGFVPDRLLSFNVQMARQPDAETRAQTAAALIERLVQIPGIETAGGATGLPTVTPQRATMFELEGRQLTVDESRAHFVAATSGFFDTLQTRVLSGRPIERSDTSKAPPVVVLNRTLARQLFGDENPVGRRLRLVNPEHSNVWRTIVGVVGDVRYRGLDDDVQPTLYTSFEQTPFMWLYMMARTSDGAPSLPRAIRTTIHDVSPMLSVGEIRAMTDVVSDTVAEPRFGMWLLTGFAALALCLAAIGIYGVIAYSVAQRSHEIGLRMALGAARRDVLSMVVREGVAVAAWGIAVGIAGAALTTRVMVDLLVGITPHDPVAFAGGAALLVLVAAAASYIPARRATRVDPMVALRAE
jgi:putative ABC transport system permease protein